LSCLIVLSPALQGDVRGAFTFPVVPLPCTIGYLLVVPPALSHHILTHAYCSKVTVRDGVGCRIGLQCWILAERRFVRRVILRLRCGSFLA
jgi:hypothetical protein